MAGQQSSLQQWQQANENLFVQQGMSQLFFLAIRVLRLVAPPTAITLTVIAADESDMPSLQTAYRDHFRESLRKALLLKLLQSRFRR